MRKTVWLIGGAAVIGVAVIGLLVWQPGVAPTPPAVTALPPATATTAPATATTEPVATVTSAPALATATATAAAPPAPPTLPPLPATATGRIDLGDGAAITLAPDWVAAPQPAPAALGFADPNGAPLLAAWRGAATYLDAPQRLTVVRTARAGIPLATYLADLAAALAQTPGLTVTGQTVTDTLRSDGLPAGLLTFTQAAPPGRGWQAVLIDPTGESLLLLTLVAQDAGAEADFRAAIRSVAFE